MKNIAIAVFALAFGTAAPVSPAGASPELVNARLVSDVSAIQPGHSFQLGVHFTIQRGWHIYAKDPGDSGLATQVRFLMPPGFQTGPLQYPAARTFTAPGDIRTYGYENTALLWAEARAPEGLPDGGKALIRADADWLGCKEQCVPGSQRLRMALPIRHDRAPSSPDARLFAEARMDKGTSHDHSAHGGKPAPDFTLPDASGKNHSLEDYRGRIVVLEWTNPQCPFVKAQYDTDKMQSLANKYTGKNVVWLTIDSSHFVTAESAGQWAKAKDVKHPVLLDPSGKVGQAYGAKTTPHIFIVDPAGNLVYEGAADDNPLNRKDETNSYVAQTLDALMAGKPVPKSETKPYGCSVKYKK